jgi:NAD(P)H-dependent FMN reductase
MAHGAFEIEIVDLAEVNLPLLDEPHDPEESRYVHQHTKDWSHTVSAADAFVFVMPEYNHGFNAALKNALDFLFHEWHYKPVGFVSYGGIAGGTRAVQMIKPVTISLGMIPIADAVVINRIKELVDDDGRFRPPDWLQDGATALLDELARVTSAAVALQTTTRSA